MAALAPKRILHLHYHRSIRCGPIFRSICAKESQEETIRWKYNFLVTATLIASICGHAPKASAQSVESFYRNKNIRFLVGTDVGAGFSAYSMLMGQFLSKHIPGTRP